METPELDSRRFKSLLEQAIAHVRRRCPEWTDFTPGDPGVTLLEAYAFLTEKLIAELNRLPEVAYIEFLRLLGLTLRPPAAAEAELVFSVTRPAAKEIRIPEGTRVTAGRESGGATPLFRTTKAIRIEKEKTEATVVALHCEWVEAELLGTSSGQPGQSFRLARPSVVAPVGDGNDLLIGVEVPSQEVGGRVHAITYREKVYRIWREVESFARCEEDRHVYLADRFLGRISFASALISEQNRSGRGGGEALAEVPSAGAEVRAWYRRGGGHVGNLAAGELTVMKDVIAGVDVVNPKPAAGGRDAETLAHALRRGPQELHSLERAVTASDFELLALRAGGISRAKAATQSDQWRYATPGTVEVLLVPEVQESNQPVTFEALAGTARDTDLRRIAEMLEDRKPLGTRCLVHWVRYKSLKVKARVSVYPGVDADLVRQRALERLHGLINPIPNRHSPAGWEFGMPLRASAIYDVLLGDAGVRFVDPPRLCIEDVPQESVLAAEADACQPSVWYASSGNRLYRSINDASGWELLKDFDVPVIELRSHPEIPGLVAVLAGKDGENTGVHLSRDCGETWDRIAETAFSMHSLRWVGQDRPGRLLLASAKGLYELSIGRRSSPVQISVEDDPDSGYRSVAVATSTRGSTIVAVASASRKGIYYSPESGRSGSFKFLGLKNEDVREMEIQRDGVRVFLWAGITVAGNEDGKGCVRWELTGGEDLVASEQSFHLGWRGGTCRALAFSGSWIYAGTHEAGLLRLDSSRADSKWEGVDIQCGLPLREERRLFAPIRSVATEPEESEGLILVGTDTGLFSTTNGQDFKPAAQRELADVVTLPPTWLFCSADHELEIVSDDIG